MIIPQLSRIVDSDLFKATNAQIDVHKIHFIYPLDEQIDGILEVIAHTSYIHIRRQNVCMSFIKKCRKKMLVYIALGIILGILATIGSVKIGFQAARYIWKHTFALLLLAVLIIWGITHQPPKQPVEPVFDSNLQQIK